MLLFLPRSGVRSQPRSAGTPAMASASERDTPAIAVQQNLGVRVRVQDLAPRSTTNAGRVDRVQRGVERRERGRPAASGSRRSEPRPLRCPLHDRCPALFTTPNPTTEPARTIIVSLPSLFECPARPRFQSPKAVEHSAKQSCSVPHASVDEASNFRASGQAITNDRQIIAGNGGRAGSFVEQLTQKLSPVMALESAPRFGRNFGGGVSAAARHRGNLCGSPSTNRR